MRIDLGVFENRINNADLALPADGRRCASRRIAPVWRQNLRHKVKCSSEGRKGRAPQEEEDALESESRELSDVATALDCAAELVSGSTVRKYVDRFEELTTEDNLDLMHEFVGQFVDKIEVCQPNSDRRKPRRVLLHGKMPGITRLDVASQSIASSNSGGWITVLGVLQERLREAA